MGQPKTTRKRGVFLGLTAVKIVLSVDRGPADGLGQGFGRFLALKARSIIAQAEGLGSFAPQATGHSSAQRSQRGHLHSLAEARESGRDYRTPKRSVIREAVWSAGSPLPLFRSQILRLNGDIHPQIRE